MSFFTRNNISTNSILNISSSIFLICSSIFIIQTGRTLQSCIRRINYEENTILSQQYRDLLNRVHQEETSN